VEAVTDSVITRKELQDKLGRSREAVRQWLKTGKLPPPDVNISRKTQGWRLSTLAAAGINIG
jgi:predicted DNA-binding transcriptional regulator AlpA